jgi:hypothetical protein
MNVFPTKIVERFSLLLLEEDEYFVKSYVADYYKDGDVNKRQLGRFIVASLSVVFDPEDVRHPILRIPLRKVTRLGKVSFTLIQLTRTHKHFDNAKYERGPLASATKLTELFMVQCSESIKMKENNRDAPYTFEHVRRERSAVLSTCFTSCLQDNQTHYFSLKFAHAVDVLTEIHEFSAIFQEEKPGLQQSGGAPISLRRSSHPRFQKAILSRQDECQGCI